MMFLTRHQRLQGSGTAARPPWTDRPAPAPGAGSRPLPVALGCMAVVLLAGCNWWLRITEVSGTVKVDGKPAGGIQLVFDPLDTTRPRALARTGPDGRFRLGRQGPGDKSGAAAGKYIVRVMSDNDGGEGFRIPVEYNVRSTLEFDVVPGRPNVFDIDVKTRSESDESAFEKGEARADRRHATLHPNPRKDRTHARRPAAGCVVDPHLRGGPIDHCG